jgi:hypothetical protein
MCSFLLTFLSLHFYEESGNPDLNFEFTSVYSDQNLPMWVRKSGMKKIEMSGGVYEEEVYDYKVK